MPASSVRPIVRDAARGADRQTTVLHVSPSFAMGGRELRVVELLGMMPPETTRHFVCALDDRRDTLARVPPGAAEVVELPAPRPARGGLWSRLRSCKAVLEELQPDLLLTYNWGSIEWLIAVRLSRLRARIVHQEDGFGPEESVRLLRRRNWLRRLALRVCDAVVVPSRTLETIARVHWKQPPERLLYLPNGVDLTRFRAADTARGPRDEVVFGCVGRIRPEKNQALAVAALARMVHQRARLRVVGDGSELEALRALATGLGVQDRVDFIGAVDDTAPEYRKFDVFLIPSRTEQMPLSLLEAMATNLPVVGTNVGDVAAMVAAENRGWIGPFERPEDLAVKMDELAANLGLRQRIGLANRVKVEAEFDRDACFGAYVALYGELVGRELAAGAERPSA